MKKHLFSALLFVAVVTAGLLALNGLMMRRDGKSKYQAFFDRNAQYDLFILGTSHVMDAVYPNELWLSSGITSYNLGNAAEPMEATYWTLRLALKEHTPKAVLIDVCYLDREQNEPTAFNHLFLDEVPLSPLKWEAVRSMFPEGGRAEFIFPLTLYHNRWSEWFSKDAAEMTDCPAYMFGSELRVGRAEPLPYTRTREISETASRGREALRRIIEWCRAEGIVPLLVAIPYPAEASAQMSMNAAARIAEAYDVPFLNLFDEPELVNFETDCYDPGSHLNPDGAYKVTRRIAEWLGENCPLPDHRGEPAYSNWEDACKLYREDVRTRWLEVYPQTGDVPWNE